MKSFKINYNSHLSSGGQRGASESIIHNKEPLRSISAPIIKNIGLTAPGSFSLGNDFSVTGSKQSQSFSDKVKNGQATGRNNNASIEGKPNESIIDKREIVQPVKNEVKKESFSTGSMPLLH